MAKLQQPDSNSFETGPLAPSGTYVAACLEVLDQFNVERPKFENPNESETLDVTRFLFGFLTQSGEPFRVQSFEFRISGSPKSNLFKFLTSWLGRAPEYGWDYCELKGEGAMITVTHKQSRDGSKTYANLVGISPVIDQLLEQIPPLAAFPPVDALASQSGPQGSSAPARQPQPPFVPTRSPNAASVPAHTASPGAHYGAPAMPRPPQPPGAQAPMQPPQNAAPWNPSDGDDSCPF